MLIVLVANLAAMMCEMTGSQLVNARCTSGASIRVMPSVQGAPSSVCPEYIVASIQMLVSLYPSHLAQFQERDVVPRLLCYLDGSPFRTSF